MSDPRIFRRRLASRLVALVSLSTLAMPGGCDGSEGLPAGGGGLGGASGTATTTGTSGTAPVQECFDWAPGMGDCPTYSKVVLEQFQCCGCPTGWEPFQIDSGPTVNGQGQCCYMVELELCAKAGRPFLVDQEARVASATFGAAPNGWQEGEPPAVDRLSAEDRAALAAAWTADALMEHASVASFSRLSLSLLAAAAPADLVELTHRAALDEVRHARLCFALATAYAGESVSPGAFPLDGPVRVPTTLSEIAVSAVEEGCIGETVAAVVAAEQLARATDPAVRAALAEIAADEARHAELAWRTVAWAVEAGGRAVRGAAARALFDALAGAWRARSSGAPGSPPATALEAHGRLDQATAARVVAAALIEVVAPAAWELFGGGDASSIDACAAPGTEG